MNETQKLMIWNHEFMIDADQWAEENHMTRGKSLIFF